jgi:type IV pilus assembly protein PilW
MISTRHYKSGFTLVELMVAIVVSSILMLGVMQIFSSNKRANMMGGGLARVQENARFAMRKITQDMRMAGYVGCAGNLKNHLDDTDDDYSDDLFDIESATAGWEFTNGSSPSATRPTGTYTLSSTIAASATNASKWDNDNGDNLHDTLDDLAIPGSDVLILKWAEGGDFAFNITNTTGNAVANTTAATNIPQDTILAITDCSAGDVFMKANNASSSSLSKGVAAGHYPGNKNPASSNWSHNYTMGATALYFISRAYFIGVGTSGEPALYRMTYVTGTTNPVVDELAEGVENMQVLFGEDAGTDNVADRYVTGDNVTDHKKVSSLKVALLVRSPNEVKPSASSTTYTLLGTNITAPNDRRVRYVFNSTVKLRNKGLK